MRMREHALFLRASTRADLLDDGSAMAWIQRVQDLTGARFDHVTDLVAVRGERVALVDPDEQLGALLPRAVHVRTRIRLEASESTTLRSFEIHAGAHPYSGAHVTQLDLRIAESALDDAAFIEQFVAFFAQLAAGIDATWAYAHPADDTAIQNATSPALLRLGYGVELDEAALRDMPGREVSRGEFRYAPDWLGWLGAPVLERLESFRSGWPARGRQQGTAFTWRLARHPADVDSEEGRSAQRQLRSDLGFDAVAAADRWTQGFWQKRGNP